MQFNYDYTTVNMTSPKSTILCIFSYPAPPGFPCGENGLMEFISPHFSTYVVCPNYRYNLAKLTRESLFYQNKGERRPNHNLLRMTSPLHPGILHSYKLLVDLIKPNLISNPQLGIFGERKTGARGKKDMMLINYKL